MTKVLLITALLFATAGPVAAANRPATGTASWYGEAHRGKLMANGKKFNPDRLTAASWFYPLGTKVRVKTIGGSKPSKSVLVTITDRGPARDLVQDGRIIDLAHAAFKTLADPDLGLIPIVVERVR